MEPTIKTLVIDNFRGIQTPYANGDINSGLAYIQDIFGYDPFSRPGDLTWSQSPELIDPTGSVITDLVLAGATREENGIVYAYCIGHTGRLYKIQVNDPTTYNPDYDNPTLVTTLTLESPTFTRGGYLVFYGSPLQIWIGHDKGVTRINFDGSGETFVGSTSSWVQNVPRVIQQFLGNLYVANGSNFAEITPALIVTSYTKLSPGFPEGSQVRDLDVNPEGNYLQAVVSELELSDITQTTPDTALTLPSNSYVFRWNGTDTGYTSYVTYPNTALSAGTLFGDKEYFFGYDYLSGGVFAGENKILSSLPSSAFTESPFPNGTITLSGNVTWLNPLPYQGNLELVWLTFGTISEFEQPGIGYWCPLNHTATAPQTDIIRTPCQILVSNFAQGSATNGYTDGIYGVPKIYYSTIETSASPSTKYRLYKWHPTPVGTGNAMPGVYQTQNQVFSKKIQTQEVRIYGDPWVLGNSFAVSLIGSGDQVIPGSYQEFTVGTNLTAGDDFAWYVPAIAPQYSVGLRIENLGATNMVINKAEIDYGPAGK